MKCNKCGYHNRGPGKCWACDSQMTEEKEKKPYKIPKVSKKQRKVSDEDWAFWLEIWNERKHKSEVSGEELPREPMAWMFSHVLTKKAYPAFRLNKKNIVLMTYQEHQDWEFGDRQDPKWDKIKALAEELKIEYYNKQTV